jgi:hypothetical protein
LTGTIDASRFESLADTAFEGTYVVLVNN